MEKSSIIEKVLDSNCVSFPALKRKLSQTALPYLSSANSSTYRCDKKRKPSKLHDSCQHVTRSFIRCYTNFMRSGVPQRVMINENGGWTDFPQIFVDQIKRESQYLKGVVKVETECRSYILDFVQMIQVDMETGLRKSIAWVDDAGKFFFPEMTIDDYEIPECHQKDVEYDEIDSQEVQEMNKIELQIDIDINKLGQCNLESTGESHDPAAILGKPARNTLEFGSSMEKTQKSYSHSTEVEKQNKNGYEFSKNMVNSEIVERYFLEGMSSVGGAEFIKVCRCESRFASIRLEVFEKQIELIRNYRGNENVRFAWLPSSKGSLPKIERYGVGYCMPLASRNSYEFGVTLSAERYCLSSAFCCDVDENGLRHMVFCRVIMGNMETVIPGSDQSYPTSEEYDSGADDLNDPKHYILWKMNMNTHIYPEFVVTFKLSPYAEGFLAGIESKDSHLGVKIFQGTKQNKSVKLSAVATGCHVEAIQNVTGDCFLPDRKDLCLPLDAGSGRGEPPSPMVSCHKKAPKSPWLPFPLLFDAISSKVSAKEMQHIFSHYQTFKEKKIDRQDFVKRLRMIVGDSLLKSTILSIPCKKALDHQVEAVKPNV